MQVLLLLGFIVGVSLATSAYTVVMLGGRQIQIPDQFTVTPSRLTYGVGATINATILMAAMIYRRPNAPITKRPAVC